MDAKTYIRRAGKYVIYLTVLLVLIFTIMDLLKLSEVPFTEVIKSERAIYLLAVVVVFALLQPFMGYVKKRLTFDARKNVEEVERIMTMCGYTRIADVDGAMVFRINSVIKRVALVYEDAITISTDSDDLSTMIGPRKEVVKAAFRMTTFVS